MKHRFGTFSAHWLIPVLALFLTALPVSALGASGEQPSDTGDITVVSSFGKAEGTVGNIMKTSFMEFTVNSASLTDQYQSLLPDHLPMPHLHSLQCPLPQALPYP